MSSFEPVRDVTADGKVSNAFHWPPLYADSIRGVDGTGILFIPNPYKNRVEIYLATTDTKPPIGSATGASPVIDAKSEPIAVIDGSGPGPSHLGGPHAVHVDYVSGRIWVLDRSYVFKVFDSSGKFLFQVKASDPKNRSFTYIAGMEFDLDGNTYMASAEMHGILKYDKNGKFVKKTVVTKGWPEGFGLGSDGSYYVGVNTGEMQPNGEPTPAKIEVYSQSGDLKKTIIIPEGAPEQQTGQGGGISGRISPATVGEVVALTTKERKASGNASIGADGSYTLAGLPAGTYDLVFIAAGHERLIGLGYLPSPDTLKPEERQAIRDVFAKYESALAGKNVDAALSCFSRNHVSDSGTPDYPELRSFFTEVFAKLDKWSSTRSIEMIAGESGKSAAVVSHTKDTMQMKPEVKTKDGSQNLLREHDALSRLAFEDGSWKVVSSESPDGCVGCDGGMSLVVRPMPGEPAKVKWRYTNDPAISGIRVAAGAESKGHDVTLTPLPQGTRQ
ncbi:MAG: hypothetical protein Q7T82_02505 [Armatimonadota bacterium]|nr:hypothetical protein [Armatimonadota bacterium]